MKGRPDSPTRHFRSSSSPVDMTKPNKGSSKQSEDWVRAKSEEITINGVSLNIVIAPYVTTIYDSKTKEKTGEQIDVPRFFKEILLKDIPNGEYKDSMVTYLMKNFHQGGLLTAVSGAFATTNLVKDKKDGCGFMRKDRLPDIDTLRGLQRSQYIYIKSTPSDQVYYFNKDEGRAIDITCQDPETNQAIIDNFNEDYPEDIDKLSISQLNHIAAFSKTSIHLLPVFSALGENMTRQRHITTTPTGFQFQEFFQVKKINQYDDNGHPLADDETMLPISLQAIPPHDYIVEGEGTLDIDFSIDPNNPTLRPTSNMITFGHPIVAAKLDQRDWTARIMDFIRYYLGLNVVQIPMIPVRQKNTDDSILKPSSSHSDRTGTLSKSDDEQEPDDGNKFHNGM